MDISKKEEDSYEYVLRGKRRLAQYEKKDEWTEYKRAKSDG